MEFLHYAAVASAGLAVLLYLLGSRPTPKNSTTVNDPITFTSWKICSYLFIFVALVLSVLYFFKEDAAVKRMVADLTKEKALSLAS